MDYKISIIIPVYNAEKRLKQCILSLTNQTLDEIEIICVDDCSEDNSEKILKELSKNDSRVKYLKMEKNSGPGLARNKGLRHSKGEYVSFVDSDDFIIDKTAYEQIYNFAIKNNSDMVSANLKFYKENGKMIDPNLFSQITLEKIIQPDEYGIPWFFQKNIFKKQLLYEQNITFPDYERGQDPVFLAHILTSINKIHCLPINFYAYREPTDINKVDTDKKELHYIKHFQDVLQILKSNKFEKMYSEYEKLMYDFFVRYKSFYSSKSIEKNIKKVFGEYSKEFMVYNFKISVKESEIEIKKDNDSLRGLLEESANELRDIVDQSDLRVENSKKENARLKRLLKESADELRYIVDRSDLQVKKLQDTNIELKRQIDAKKNEHAELLKSYGFLKYKTCNIVSRIKNKLSNFYSSIRLKFWYKNLTIIIPYRRTNDPEREENLDLNLKYLSKIGMPKILISEHADISSSELLLKEYGNLFNSFKVIYHQSNGELFNKSIAINRAVIESDTPFVAVFDADCLTKKENIDMAANLMEQGYELVHLFNRKVTDIVDKVEFRKEYDFSSINSPLQDRPWADGGMIFWNKKSFIDIGMMNEYFSGWGGEDNEVIVRANLCQLKKFRINDTLYHLHHHRPLKRTQNNIVQMDKIENLRTKKECLEEIKKWPWVINAKKIT